MLGLLSVKVKSCIGITAVSKMPIVCYISSQYDFFLKKKNLFPVCYFLISLRSVAVHSNEMYH